MPSVRALTVGCCHTYVGGVGLTDEFKTVLAKAYHYFDVSQVAEEVDNLEHYFRHISKGAWPFSTRDHGWPISGTLLLW